MKELHLTEGRSTGIPIIYDVMEKNGSPKPDFDTDEACTYFLTVLYSHPELMLDVDDQGSDQAADQGLRVLELCKQPHSRKEILEVLGVSNHSTNYKRFIEPLLEKEWLEMTIPDKPTSGNQKYQTTPKGQRILQNSDQAADQATDQELQVLELCKQPHSRKEMLEALGLSNHQYNYQHYIEPLLEHGWLEFRVRSSNNNIATIKAQTTTKYQKVIIL